MLATKEQIEAEYEKSVREAMANLQRVSEALARYRNKHTRNGGTLDYGHVGSINKVAADLREIGDFISPETKGR